MAGHKPNFPSGSIAKVGIGTASPAEMLEINGNIKANKLIARTTNAEVVPEPKPAARAGACYSPGGVLVNTQSKVVKQCIEK